jgi:nucleotide-binding universal stress UspA family protein
VAAIICGVNESPGAIDAVRVASALSAGFETRLVLAHVAYGWTDTRTKSLTTEQGRQGGNRLLERIARESSLQAERRVEVGEPVEALARIAAEEAANLIVVGSQRQGWRRPRLRSRLAGDLAAAAPCPVVVVPPQPRR